MMEVKKSIYIVEDQGITRVALKKVLESNGYNVLGSASSAEKAWLALQEVKVDLVLLDFTLKGNKTGHWLAQKINEKLGIPFVFLTAYGSKEFLEKLFTTKPAGYIMKPFNNPTLLSTIKIALTKYSEKPENIHKVKTKFLKTKTGLVKFSTENVLYLQSIKNYIIIYTTDGIYEIRDKLDNVLNMLDFNSIYRIHRRFAVNLPFISKIENTNIHVKDAILPISKSYHSIHFKEICLQVEHLQETFKIKK